MTTPTPIGRPDRRGESVEHASVITKGSANTARVFADAQAFELDWWQGAINTFGEEAKQITYAHRMGLVNTPQDGKWPVYDLEGKSVLDLGGGPVSMLLKNVNGGHLCVVDPCPYPTWIAERYAAAGVSYAVAEAEGFTGISRDPVPGGVCESVGCGGSVQTVWDECWIYNVLEHVVDPRRVIETAKRHARVIRIFEWLETPPSPGHPHTLHADEMNEWLGGTGSVEMLDENGAVGLAYYGVFDTRTRAADNGQPDWSPVGTAGPVGG